jgi:MoaA/NifB/PqqE/SkfB family radical SAM enzyme
MKRLKRLAMRWKRPKTAVQPGLYHFMRDAGGAVSRFHLRVDSAGDGLLLANAATMARLTASGVVIAKGLLEGKSFEEIARHLLRHFHFRGVPSQQVRTDVDAVKSLIERMESPGKGYPLLNLADPVFSPKNMPLERPISADVPLCELPQLNRILERLWHLGIPHATFIAGWNCDNGLLIRAVERAGDLGLITGVRGRGTELAAGTLVKDMAAAGLDHLDVICLSAVEEVHDALAGKGDFQQSLRALQLAKENNVCPVAQLALVGPTSATIDQTLDFLLGQGIENLCVFSIASGSPGEASDEAISTLELPSAMRMVEESAERLGLRLMWQPPVPRDPAVSLGEQVCQGPRSSGDSGVRIEADGSVIPARGPKLAAGNIFTDRWEKIENGRVFQEYLARLKKEEV